eukprot:UN21943
MSGSLTHLCFVEFASSLKRRKGQPMAAAFINSIILLILKEKNEMN